MSQESLDRDDNEILTRRSRIKTMRARSSSHKESVDSGDVDHGGEYSAKLSTFLKAFYIYQFIVRLQIVLVRMSPLYIFTYLYFN